MLWNNVHAKHHTQTNVKQWDGLQKQALMQMMLNKMHAK